MSTSSNLNYKNVIIKLNTDELCTILEQNGFSDCCVVIRSKQIDGEDFLNLTEGQVSLWLPRLKRTQVINLMSAVQLSNRDPQKFYNSNISQRSVAESQIASTENSKPANSFTKRQIRVPPNQEEKSQKKIDKPLPPLPKSEDDFHQQIDKIKKLLILPPTEPTQTPSNNNYPTYLVMSGKSQKPHPPIEHGPEWFTSSDEEPEDPLKGFRLPPPPKFTKPPNTIIPKRPLPSPPEDLLVDRPQHLSCLFVNSADDYKRAPWFYNVNRQMANEMLRGRPNGSFIVRPTNSEQVCTLAILYSDYVYNLGIKRDDFGLLTIGAGGIKRTFITVNEIVDFYTDNEFTLNYKGREVHVKLFHFN